MVWGTSLFAGRLLEVRNGRRGIHEIGPGAGRRGGPGRRGPGGLRDYPGRPGGGPGTQPEGRGPERVMPWGAGGHRPGLQNAGRLAALAVYAVRHPGALPHVRRSHSQRADSPGGVRRAGPKAGACGSVCDLFSEPFNHHQACTAGVLEEPCAQILREFFRNLRVELPNRTKWKRPE